MDIDKLFDTPEKREEAKLHFEGLKQDAGWRLFVKVIQNKIESLRRDLEEGTEDETTAEIQNKRNLLKAHRWFLSFPDDRIREFSAEEIDPEVSLDPYDKPPKVIIARKRKS